MGAGRKTRTLSVREVPVSGPPKANYSVSARNLRKGDLFGVIFGCKNYTINECLSQKIFGLPGSHFSYVKNIVPRLPVFLFNYSDRTLHGIFEAASYGRMNINPHGWSANGNEETEYPAQVRITIRMRCQALKEEQFRPVIDGNYYTDNHFWFELDRVQTSELMSLFEASSSSAQSAIPKKVYIGESPSAFAASSSSADSAFPKKVNIGESTSSFAASSVTAHSAIQKKGFSWCDVVKTLPNPDKENGKEDSEPTCNLDRTNEYDVPWPAVSETYMGGLDLSKMESHLDSEASDKEEEPLVSPLTEEILTDFSELMLTTDQEMKSVTAGDSVTSEMPSVQKDFPEEPLVSAEKEEISVFPSDCQRVIAQLMLEVQKLQTFSLKQLKKTSSLEKNLSDSQVQIQQLKSRLKNVESILDPTLNQNDESDWDWAV